MGAALRVITNCDRRRSRGGITQRKTFTSCIENIKHPLSACIQTRIRIACEDMEKRAGGRGTRCMTGMYLELKTWSKLRIQFNDAVPSRLRTLPFQAIHPQTL